MKRKRLKPRNRLVAAGLFRKAGAHGKSEKALRRAAKIETQWGAGVVAAHRTFNPAQDEFESLAPHQQLKEKFPVGQFFFALFPSSSAVEPSAVNRVVVRSIRTWGAKFLGV